MLTALHPVCHHHSLPVTVISLMMDPISRPSRGVQTHQGSPFLTYLTGKGISLILFTDANKEMHYR